MRLWFKVTGKPLGLRNLCWSHSTLDVGQGLSGDLNIVRRSEVEPFLRYFYLLDYKLPEVSIKYDKLMHEDDPEEKKRLGAEIADDLAKEFIVLPLYQNVREYHYPRGIKNLTVGRGFFEFPEVADFRW